MIMYLMKELPENVEKRKVNAIHDELKLDEELKNEVHWNVELITVMGRYRQDFP
jgi:hypothetical protein